MPARALLSPLLVALALPLSLACTPGAGGGPAPDTAWRPLHRFADLVAGGGRPRTASIRDETRTVLRGHARGMLLTVREATVAEDGRLEFAAFPFPGAQHAGRLLVSPRVRVDRRWRRFPWRVRPVRVEDDRVRVDIALELPGQAGRTLEIGARGVALPDAEARIETPAVAIPPLARLEFALGILDPGWRRGPVAFAIEVCERDACERIFEETLDPSRPVHRGWQDRRVDLAPQAGRTLSFRFQTRALGKGPHAASLPVWGHPTLYASAPRDDDDVNLVLVSIDTLRADHLPSYGYPRETAPFVRDGLAARGVLFERCIAQATTTAPSHMTLFTGLAPSVHGVRAVAGFDPVPEGAVLLAEALRSHGFETGAVTEDGPMAAERGFVRGFDVYAENKNAKTRSMDGHLARTLARGRAWIEQHREKRFFLFLHTFQVHNPYLPPPDYASLFAERAPELEPPPGLPVGWHPVLYDREIRYVDDGLRAFYGFLEAQRLAERTLFVFVSDHGEAFLEHGYYGHGAVVNEEVLHVPLVLRGPGLPEGLRVKQPVGLVDLMPTLLELMGVPSVPGLMGRSVAALARGRDEAGSDARERPLYSEAWHPTGRRAHGERVRIEQPTLAVRVGRHKLVRHREDGGFRYVYYDLAADPGERDPRSPDQAPAARELRALLDHYEGVTAELRGALLARSPETGEPVLSLDPDREEKLRALGYIE